ncbi:GrpB family protein [Arthrobacter sp. zg-Y769]|uniref:GrpB family protein n=1 Tax=Arthrobacter sp. zg-Y769 TaxID=2894191 RepID=UPI001E4DECD8|nr:GrpB family protein [Arthrobacter sp. zg-Y769]MCC9204423.1 GrpB family protein [Arthrobacter sp. zg-Y769]
MAARLRTQVPGARLEHIGSTSVPGLAAKDVVDLLIGVEENRVAEVAAELAADGFDLEGELPGHCWLSYPARASRRYILHVVEFDGVPWRRRIGFRDLLRRDESARARYLEAKLEAAREAQGWDDYTQFKTPVVAGLLAQDASGSCEPPALTGFR